MTEKHPNAEAVLVLNAKIREALVGFAVEGVEISAHVPLKAGGSQLHYRTEGDRQHLYVLWHTHGTSGIVNWEGAGTRTKIQIAKALPRLREEILHQMEVQRLEVLEAAEELVRFLSGLRGAEIREKIEKA